MFGLLKRRNRPGREARHPRLDKFRGTVWAIADVHGCLRELLELERMIMEDARAFPRPHVLVYLGDYVDRGPHSSGVVRHLLEPPPEGFRRFLLEGNHEALMRQFLAAPVGSHRWLEVGGLDTLVSYGIEPPREESVRWQRLLAGRIPDEHKAFLDSLALTVQINRCVFVHAGLKPDVALEDQKESDLLWMREEAQSDWAGGPYVVIHGHTIVDRPRIVGQRIAIDTGAFRTGRLTAVRLGAGGYKFLST